jgi:hypothetical protein
LGKWGANSQFEVSCVYVVSKDQIAFMADLKLVYKASSKDLAGHHLLELEEKWGRLGIEMPRNTICGLIKQ